MGAHKDKLVVTTFYVSTFMVIEDPESVINRKDVPAKVHAKITQSGVALERSPCDNQSGYSRESM